MCLCARRATSELSIRVPGTRPGQRDLGPTQKGAWSQEWLREFTLNPSIIRQSRLYYYCFFCQRIERCRIDTRSGPSLIVYNVAKAIVRGNCYGVGWSGADLGISGCVLGLLTPHPKHGFTIGVNISLLDIYAPYPSYSKRRVRCSD